MKIELNTHFTFKKLLLATLPSMLMMLFTSIYSIVDGLFVSNFVGKTAFAAVNLMMPVIVMIGALGFMMGSGGTALIGKTLGEKDYERANKYFSQIVYFTIIIGLIVSFIVFFFIKDIAIMLGAKGELLEYSIKYARIMISFEVMYMLQNAFQNLFMAANKALLGFSISVIAGITNIIGDALLVGVFNFGVEGAAIATVLSQSIAGLVPIIYFSRRNSSALKLVKTSINMKTIYKAATNGASELLSNISQSLVSMVYNKQLMSYVGEDGISAYGVIMYVGYMFTAIYLGYSLGQSGYVAYNYGAQDTDELKNIRKKSLIINSSFGIVMLFIVELFATPLAKIFVGYDEELLNLTVNGFKLYGICYLISGINIYTSSFFTSLNNGLISGLSSFLRTFVFQIIAVIILPLLFGLTGIWLSMLVAEIMSLTVNTIFFVKYKKRYNY